MANVGTLSVNVVAITGQFDARMGSVRQSLQLTAIATKGVSSGMSGMLGTLGALGPAAAAAAALAIGMQSVKQQVTAVVSTFGDFEHSMARVKAIAEPTAEEFRAMWQQAKSLGESTIFTSSDAAKAMNELAQAGLNASQMSAALPGTMNLAAAGELDMAEAARIATNAMSNFQLTAGSATGVADLLAKAAADSKTNVRELGEAMEFVGPVANAAGKDIFETVAVLESLAQQGLRGEKGGTGFRRLMMDLSELTPIAKAEIERLEIELTDAEGRFLHMADIVDQFNEKLGDVGPAEKLQSLGKIFDTNAVTAMAAAMNEGGESIRRFDASARQAGNEAQRMADVSMDTLKGKTEQLSGSVERLRITLGEGGLGRELKGVIDLSAETTSSFSKMLEVLQGGPPKEGDGEGLIEHRFRQSQKFLSQMVEKTARLFGQTDFADAMRDEIKFAFDTVKKEAESTATAIEQLDKAKQKIGGDGAALGDAAADALKDVEKLLEAKEKLEKPVSVGAAVRGTTAGFSAERQAADALNALRAAENVAARQRQNIQGVLERILKQGQGNVAVGAGPQITVNNVSL